MKLYKIGLPLTALIFAGGGYSFSQSQQTRQIMKTEIKQSERIAVLEKRIAEAVNDFASLTSEEYDLLLSQPTGTVEGFEPLTTTAGGIMVGYGFPDGPRIYKTDIQTTFANIPYIGEGDVFILLDSVKGSNGLDYIAPVGNMEKEENTFTDLELYVRTAGSKTYLFGSRYVNLRDPSDSMTVRALGALGGDAELSAVSGKVVMHLPTNITGLTLTKGDIGVEKPFAGGMMTLKEIKDDHISFQFTGNDKDIFAWHVYDSKDTILNIKEVIVKDGIYQLFAQHPQSVKVYQAKIVKREYPFAFAQKSKPTPSALLEGIEAVRFSAAMFFQTQLLQSKKAATIYLDKNDPIVTSIKGRAVADLRQSARYMNPESPESKAIGKQMNAWSEEKKNQLQALGQQSIGDYTSQTFFDVGTFMLVFDSFNEMDQKKIPEEWDIRVQHPVGDKYIAEFWEDSHIVHPESKDEIGENARYYKMMALIYTLGKDGSVTYYDPFQPVIEFLKK
ncbi:MAG: hypothetical protein M0Q53_04100 [Prolixibacteraceae bacterium]|jgi:hypothetical protein|nr:hypothetical protein [Prolixibacteraceae bacterium]